MLPDNTPHNIILHCSAGQDRIVKDWDMLRDYHKGKGWSDIGYHYGVEKVGDTYQIMEGRPDTTHGAHCIEQSMNYNSLGVCMVGDFDEHHVPQDQWKLTVQLVADKCAEYDIHYRNIFPHRHFNQRKTCPGKKVDMGMFRSWVNEYLNFK